MISLKENRTVADQSAALKRSTGGRSSAIATAMEIIEEARNGRMVILIDDEDQEHAGAVVLPAQYCTPKSIAFMAVNGRGLVCLALTEQRVRELGLAPMVKNNRTRHGTAFTTSIEARDGVDTGISAADRARTVAAAIDSANGPEVLVTPGHMFPLIARDGGVFVRAGHAEAAVDLARLAGLNPSGVICEVLTHDGSMARLDDLLVFANAHNLKIGTVSDMIAHRIKYDKNIRRVRSFGFESRWGGSWEAVVYRGDVDGGEVIAFVKGRLAANEPVLVCMHFVEVTQDIMGRTLLEAPIERAMRLIGEEGTGVLVLFRAKGMLGFEEEGAWTENRNQEQLSDNVVGAQILADLGVHDVIAMLNSDHTLTPLSGYGLRIVGERSY